MARGVRWYRAGPLVLVTLAGCGRSFLQYAEREPWRREAEAACLSSGAVKEGSGLVRIAPIEGPGVCGAEYPFKVAAFGASQATGYTDELRPPGSIPNASQMPRWPVASPRRSAPSYSAQPLPPPA